MKLFNYLLGGMFGLFVVVILSVFSLSTIDHYLLRANLASVISAVLVELANEDRNGNALGVLTINPILTAAAQAKANDMATKGYFAHVSPDGVDSWYWFKQSGYTFLYAGENLAVDFSDSVEVERAWMNSPTHRANILNGYFTQIGIATAQGTYQGHQTTFVVQMFGTPSPKSDLVLGTPATSTAPGIVVTTASPKEPTSPAFATTEMSTSTAVLGTKADSILPITVTRWQHLLASPKTWLRYAYYAIAGIVLIILAYVTELEFHRRHMCHVWAAALLFVLMGTLFIIANFVLFAEPVIAAI